MLCKENYYFSKWQGKNWIGVKMKHKHLLVVSALLVLLFASAAVATDMSLFHRGGTVESVTGLTAAWENSCAVFKWNATADADFNNFVVQTVSNQSVPNLNTDVNTRANEYVLCTLAAGNWVKATVYRIDGNTTALPPPADTNYTIWKNVEPDANVTLNPGSETQAGQFLVYNVLLAIGGIIALVILVAIVIMILKIFNIKSGFFGKL